MSVMQVKTMIENTETHFTSITDTLHGSYAGKRFAFCHVLGARFAGLLQPSHHDSDDSNDNDDDDDDDDDNEVDYDDDDHQHHHHHHHGK